MTAGWTERTRERSYPVDRILETFESIELVAEVFDVETRTVHRWVEEGGVSVNVADRLATALGVHPVDVWPSWFDDAVFDTENLDEQEARRRKHLGSRKHREDQLAMDLSE